MFARGQEEAGGSLFNGYGVSFGIMKWLWKLAVVTVVQRVNVLNVPGLHILKVVNVVNLMFCAFYHNKKIT